MIAYRIVHRLLGLGLAGVLLMAALAKVANFDLFLEFLWKIKFASPLLVFSLALLVPAFEMALAVLLLIGPPAASVRRATVGLFSLFLVFHILQSNPGSSVADASCPCFGELFPNLGSVALIVRSGLFLGAAVAFYKISNIICAADSARS